MPEPITQAFTPHDPAYIQSKIAELLPPPLLRLIEMVTEEAESESLSLYLVGGFVRDLLLGMRHEGKAGKADLDFVVEGSAIRLAQRVQARWGGKLSQYPQFGTATWHAEPSEYLPLTALIDFVTARREHYPHPGMLPVVEPSTIAEDLARRDFTINAMAIRLAPAPFGTLFDPFNGLVDLHTQQVRVLHNSSFIDDATRIFRAVRFEQRLGFHITPETEALVGPSLVTLDHISGERLRTEFDLMYLEATPETMLQRLDSFGILKQIAQRLVFDERSASAFIELRRMVLDEATHVSLNDHEVAVIPAAYEVILGCCVDNPDALSERLALDRHRHRWLAQGHDLWRSLARLEQPLRPSEVAEKLDSFDDVPLIAIRALSQNEIARDQIGKFLRFGKHVRPTLTGDKLKMMGLSPSPRFGKILRALRMALIDGDVRTADDEQAFVEQWLKDHPEN